MIDRMNRRERAIVFSGAAFLLILLIWFGVVAPYQKAIVRYDKKIITLQQTLIEVYSLKGEIESLREAVSKVAGTVEDEDFNLFSHVEGLTVSSGVKANLLSIRPQPVSQQGDYQMESVDVRLEKVTIEQLVRFLEDARKEKRYLPIRQLRIKSRFEDKSKLNATMLIAYYKP